MSRIVSIALIVVMAGVAIAGIAQEGKPEDEFRKALAAQNEKELEKACRNLVTLGSPAAAKLILGSLGHPKLETDVYWILIRACAAFATTDSLDEVAEYILNHKGQPAARDLAMAMHNNFNGAVEAAMIKILVKGDEELKLLALDHLADLGKKDAVAAIIDMLKKEGDRPASTEVRRRMLLALGGLTGQDYGSSISNWTGWWDANSGKSWEEIRKGGKSEGGKGGEFGHTRSSDFEEVKQNKVLLIHSGNGCRCGNNHDLDRQMTQVIEANEIKLDKILKHLWEGGNKLDSGEAYQPSDYIAIVVMCTQIKEHCVCKDCKPGGDKNNRMFQCTGCNKHENTSYRLGKKGVDKLKKYVEGGGYLFTEDWALEEVVTVAWPELVKMGKKLKEQDVSVLPKPGSGSHPYLRKIFVKPPSAGGEGRGTTVEEDVSQINHKWHVDDESPAIGIVDKKRVTTLLFSETIGVQSSKEGSDAVAITFAAGKLDTATANDPVATGGAPVQNREKMVGGRVLHVLSHFGKQGSDDAGQNGEATLLNLLVNYLSEAASRRKLAKKP